MSIAINMAAFKTLGSSLNPDFDEVTIAFLGAMLGKYKDYSPPAHILYELA